MASKIKGKATAADLAESLIAGIQKRLPNGSLTFAGGTFTAAQITSELQEIVDLRSGVTVAQAATKVKVDAETAKLPALRAFMSALVQCIRVAFGTQADALADFGLPPKKVAAPRTVEQKAAAAAKAEATRQAAGHEEHEGQEGDQGRRYRRRGDPRRGRRARRAGAHRPHRRPQHGSGDGRDGAAHRLEKR